MSIFNQPPQPTSVNGTVGISSSENVVKIVDKTNTAHVASVSNNGSVHSVITNDSGSAVPIEIFDSGGNPNSYADPIYVLAQIADAPGDNIVVVANNNGTIQTTNPLSVRISDGSNLASISAGQLLVRNHVRYSNGVSAEQRIQDRWVSQEWASLANNSAATLWTASATTRINLCRLTFYTTIAGIYFLKFEGGLSQDVAKFYVNANTQFTLDLGETGILSAPANTGGTLKLYNNTGNATPAYIWALSTGWES